MNAVGIDEGQQSEEDVGELHDGGGGGGGEKEGSDCNFVQFADFEYTLFDY